MSKIKVICRRCGKEMRADFSDTSTICKKCRKMIPAKVVNTTRNFDF